jgi:hypothetical protein
MNLIEVIFKNRVQTSQEKTLRVDYKNKPFDMDPLTVP